MAVKKLTASQAAQYTKIMNTPLNQVMSNQASTTRQNVSEGKIAAKAAKTPDAATRAQTSNVKTLNKGYGANPTAYLTAAKNLNVDLAKVNPSAYAAQQKASALSTKVNSSGKYGPSKQTKSSLFVPTTFKGTPVQKAVVKPAKTTGKGSFLTPTRTAMFAKGGMAARSGFVLKTPAAPKPTAEAMQKTAIGKEKHADRVARAMYVGNNRKPLSMRSPEFFASGKAQKLQAAKSAIPRASMMSKGGMATTAKKSGIDGIAIRGKTKGTLVTKTKMSGSRRSK